MTPDQQSQPAEPANHADGGKGDEGRWPDYQFHDPVWLTWWLESLYQLPPQQQAEVALRLQSTIYSPEAQEVLSEFLDHLRIRFNLGVTSQHEEEEVVERTAQPANAWWEKVMERMLGSFRPFLWLLAFGLGSWILSLATSI